MSAIAKKRILTEMKTLVSSPPDADGIYIKFNQDNIFKIYAMILSSKDTPYTHGYWFFEITIGPNYPFEPPVFKFRTLNSNVRFNPNLYTDGKVCLSVINTWSGDGWKPEMTICSVLRCIQSMVLIENPLINEPGYTNKTNYEEHKYKFSDYIAHVTYAKFVTGILEMLISTPTEFEDFIPVMQKYYIDNYDKIMQELTEFDEANGSLMSFPTTVYDKSINRDIDLRSSFTALYESLKYIL